MNDSSENRRADRRTDRTRRALADALVELILEKGYEVTTVQDVLDRANVGRSTFYAHFESKEELLFSGHSWLKTDSFFAEPGDGASFYGIDLQGLFEHATANQRLARAMLGKNSGELVIGHIRDVLYLRIRKTLKARPSSSEVELDLTAEAMASMLVGLLRAWLEASLAPSPERMVALTRSLMAER